MSFCSVCGASAHMTVPVGDNRPRLVCSRCKYIHYENPRLVIGCIAAWEGKILLCRRAIEPRQGFWTLPAGFMENGETTAQAAMRETHEEAGAYIDIDAAFMMVSIAHINQVHLFYRGRMINEQLDPGEESLEACLFLPADIPWQELSFPSVRLCLERYLADQELNQFRFHEISLNDPSSAIEHE